MIDNISKIELIENSIKLIEKLIENKNNIRKTKVWGTYLPSSCSILIEDACAPWPTEEIKEVWDKFQQQHKEEWDNFYKNYKEK